MDAQTLQKLFPKATVIKCLICYKAGVYCKVVSQGEVKVTLYGGERATFRLTHCDVRDLRLTNGSMHRI